jgi:transcriptional regulator NrdR family protein
MAKSARKPKDTPPEPRGLECPRCGCRHFFVVYTRPAPRGQIRRVRECRHCGRRVVSVERIT